MTQYFFTRKTKLIGGKLARALFLILGALEYLSRFFPRISNIRIPIYKLYSLERRKILRWSAISITIVVERV
jgi:hypothetical protein